MVFSTSVAGKFDINTPFGKLTDLTSGDEEGVKDKECPINGENYTKSRQEKWEGRRPLAIMVENHEDARPVRGLSRSDVIYEAISEGGITRFLAIFYCQDAGDIAPIRSARTYFLDWLSEYDAAYVHVGGANTAGPANALEQIREYEIKDLDQFGVGFPTYWRGTDRLAPHNVHSTTTKLWETASERGFGAEDIDGVAWDKNFIKWAFKDGLPFEQRGDQTKIEVPYWPQSPNYTVSWNYDKNTNEYKRSHAEIVQIDPVTEEVLKAKNVIVQFQTERDANDGHPDGHLLYGTIGRGSVLIFQNGNVIKGSWVKDSRTARTKYLDSSGDEIELVRGTIWIHTIPIGNDVAY